MDQKHISKPFDALAGAAGFIAGLIPHIIHHAGVIIGVAFLTGTFGTIVFGLLGFLLTVPMLLQLYKRYKTVAAPVIALAIFILMFLVSSFIVGPIIRGQSLQIIPSSNQNGPHSSHH